MTSEARDLALLGGQPIKLFRFLRQNTTWCYTNADQPITINGNTYLPEGIDHSNVTDGGDKVSITITMPKTAAVVENWWPYPPADPIAVAIWTQHAGEDDWLVDWIGNVISAQFDDTTITLTSEPTQQRARRGGAQRICQSNCDLLHYSQGRGQCGVDKAQYALPSQLLTVNGLTLTADAFGTLPNGRLAGGWIEWTRADGIVESCSTAGHSGSTIVLLYGGDSLSPGLNVTAYPGCAQTWDDCTYYNNTARFGGELYLPGRNYYDGNFVGLN